MERTIYKLTQQKTIKAFKESIKDLSNPDDVVVKPLKLSICYADHRYYYGLRPKAVLDQKLPMALIHEGIGEIVHTHSKDFPLGSKVVMLPNILSDGDKDPQLLENYNPQSIFLSSRADGFLQSLIKLPLRNVLSVESIKDLKVASLLEPLSVGVHAVERLKTIGGSLKHIAIWGDGAISHLLCIALKHLLPEVKVTVVGKHLDKLEHFRVDHKIILSKDYHIEPFDAGFEVVGSHNAKEAINDIIKFIKPMGKIFLMGVSEELVAINTRDILEKGLTMVGVSRSTREDFAKAIEILEKEDHQEQLRSLIYKEVDLKTIEDIHKAFDLFNERKGRIIMNLNLPL